MKASPFTKILDLFTRAGKEKKITIGKNTIKSIGNLTTHHSLKATAKDKVMEIIYIFHNNLVD